MSSVNIFEAKTSFSKLVESIVQGHTHEIVIARHGRPVAKLVPIDAPVTGKRLGVAKGKFEVPDDIDLHNDEVTRLFHGGDRT